MPDQDSMNDGSLLEIGPVQIIGRAAGSATTYTMHAIGLELVAPKISQVMHQMADMIAMHPELDDPIATLRKQGQLEALETEGEELQMPDLPNEVVLTPDELYATFMKAALRSFQSLPGENCAVARQSAPELLAAVVGCTRWMISMAAQTGAPPGMLPIAAKLLATLGMWQPSIVETYARNVVDEIAIHQAVPLRRTEGQPS